MTQARTPAGSAAGAGGGEYIVTATQIPTDITWEDVPGAVNRLRDGQQTVENDVTTSADFVWRFVAEDNGVITGLRYGNGAVAADGTNGWELQFINSSNSDDVVAYFGLGTGTEAAKATDSAAVAADASVDLINSDTSRFNKGDVIEVTADRDGTTIVGKFTLLLSYESEGR